MAKFLVVNRPCMKMEFEITDARNDGGGGTA